MGRSRIGWALSVAAPWCVAFVVLVSITAEAGARTDRADQRLRPQPVDERLPPGSTGRPRRRPPRAVDEDGAPLPIVQARYGVGDPDELATDQDESEPNGTLKPTGRAFPAVDRGAKGDPVFGAPDVNAKRLNGKRSAAEPYAYKSWPRELEDPRDDEFDPGHTMSPAAPGRRRRARQCVAQFRRRRDAGGAARICAQLLFAHLERRRRRRCRGR